MKSKKPPETVSFPAALPVSFHGIGPVCRKADILPEVINDIFAKENSGERQLGICFPRQIQIAIALLVSDGKRGHPFLCRIPRHLRHESHTEPGAHEVTMKALFMILCGT